MRFAPHLVGGFLIWQVSCAMISLADPDLEPIRPLLERLFKRRFSSNFVWRWVHGKNSSGIRLPAIKAFGRLYSTPAAIEEFIAECSNGLGAELPPVELRKQRRKRIQNPSERDLKALGLM